MQSTVLVCCRRFFADSVWRSPATGFLRSLQTAGEIGRPSQGLTVKETVYILVRSAEGAKQDAKVKSDRQVLQQHLRKLAALALCRDEKVIRSRNLCR